uniref:Uncharacterized protein n=1 Tax=Bracon brevicornis TaxID=1563983 RepID=A0A6V7KYJ8_9HYME
MPPIWSSSERPISVRTVWVDGIRHAILTHDDPLINIKNRTRPQTSIPPTKPKIFPPNYVCREALRTPDSLDNCFVNHHVVVNKKDREIDKKHVIRRQSAPINRITSPLNLDLNGILKVTCDSGDSSKINSGRSCDHIVEEITEQSCEEDFNDNNKNCVTYHEDDNSENNDINPLSERVLQWMDMSGRVKSYSERDEFLKNTLANRKALVRAKVSSFRRQNSGICRDIVTAHNYKLIPTKKSEDSEDEPKVELKKDSPRIDSKTESKSIVPLHNNKSIWSPLGRPQLHIFMPDLNSSGEDTSSQDSLTIEEQVEDNLISTNSL